MSDKDRPPLKTVVIPGEQLPEGDAVISVVDRSPNLNERIMLALADYIDPEKDLHYAYRAVVEAILSEGGDIPEAEPERSPSDGSASPFEALKGLIDGELTSAPFSKGDIRDFVFPEISYDNVEDAESAPAIGVLNIDVNSEDFRDFLRETKRTAKAKAEAVYKKAPDMSFDEALEYFKRWDGNVFAAERAAEEYRSLTAPDRVKAQVKRIQAEMREEQEAESSGNSQVDMLNTPHTDEMADDVGVTADLRAAPKTGADTLSPDTSPAISTDVPIDAHFVAATNRSDWGAILKTLREENDVSIREMARRFGSSPVRIRQIENPKTDLRTETIQKYLTALGVQFEVGVRVTRGMKPR